MEYWKIRQEDFINENKQYEQERTVSNVDDGNYFMIKSELKKPEEGNQGNFMSIYFKKYDNCFASIGYTNPERDK